MIHESTIGSVNSILNRIDGRYTLSPYLETPLAAMVGASQPLTGNPDTNLNDICNASQDKNVQGVCHHDVVCDEIVPVVSQSVNNTLKLARTIALPNIRQVEQRASEILKASDVVGDYGVEIVPETTPALVNTSQVREQVSRYGDATFNNIPLTLRLGSAVDAQTAKDLLPTSGPLAQDIAEAAGDDFLVSLYNMVFGDPQSGDTSQDVMARLAMGELPLVILMAMALKDNPPEKTNMGLSQYELYMTQIAVDASIALNNRLRRRDGQERRGEMVTFFPSNHNGVAGGVVITVNSVLYNRFIQDGGSPDAVLGAYLSSDQPRTLQAIKDNQASFERTWALHKGFADDTHKLERQGRAYRALSQAVYLLIQEMDNDELPIDRDLIVKRVEPAVAKLKGMFYEQWYVSARQVVCEVLYPHTDVMRILCAIDRRAENNPDMNVREAAYLGLIDYISWWVAQQITVAPEGGSS